MDTSKEIVSNAALKIVAVSDDMYEGTSTATVRSTIFYTTDDLAVNLFLLEACHIELVKRALTEIPAEQREAFIKEYINRQEEFLKSFIDERIAAERYDPTENLFRVPSLSEDMIISVDPGTDNGRTIIS